MDAQLWGPKSNTPGEKRLNFKFTVDAGNAPALAAAPDNFYIASVSRVSQGLYRLTFSGPMLAHVATLVAINKNAADGGGHTQAAHPGPIANFGTSSAPTVDILILGETGAVADPPAANANNFVAGCIICRDVGSV